MVPVIQADRIIFEESKPIGNGSFHDLVHHNEFVAGKTGPTRRGTTGGKVHLVLRYVLRDGSDRFTGVCASNGANAVPLPGVLLAAVNCAKCRAILNRHLGTEAVA